MIKAPFRFLMCLLAALFVASVPVFAFDIVDSEDNMVQIVEPPPAGETDVAVVDSGTDETPKTNPSTGEAANRLLFLTAICAGAAYFAGKKLGEKVKSTKQI
jgi:hypothetical protein